MTSVALLTLHLHFSCFTLVMDLILRTLLPVTQRGFNKIGGTGPVLDIWLLFLEY